ncbi:Glutathione S-transferase F11, partial [Leucoagaricus sp. SymC.cos]
IVFKLYGWVNSTGAKPVALILRLKQIPFEYIEVGLPKSENKRQPYTDIQPFGQVPTLDDNGFIPFESRAIARYFVEKYPGQGISMASTVIYSAVPELVRNKNFQDWRCRMRHALACTIIPEISYTGLDVATGIQVCPVPPIAGAPTANKTAAIHHFETMDNICLMMIDGKLAPNLLQHGQTRTVTLWTHLETAYGICTTSGIYSDYQKTLTFRIDPNIEPSMQLAYLEDLYQTLQSGTPTIIIPPFICAMNLLNAVPLEWNSLVSTFFQTHDVTTTTFNNVHNTITTEWTFHLAQKAHLASMSHQGMRFKSPQNPNWQQQQCSQPSGQQQHSSNQSGNQQQSGGSSDQKKKKNRKHGKGGKGNAADLVEGADEITSSAITTSSTQPFQASSAFGVTMLTIMKSPIVLGSSTQQKMNDARASYSPTYTPPLLPTNIVVSLPPPQSPIAPHIPPTLHTDTEMISLGENESDYGDDTYVPNYGLDNGTIQGQTAKVKHLCSQGLTKEPACQCCPFG